MSNIYSIYLATNIVTQDQYVGYTENYPKRYKQHEIDSRLHSYECHFHRAIRKYGWDNFEWEIIYQSLEYEHTKNKMEPHFIEYYNTFHNGYNMTPGGEGRKVNHSLETIQLISENRTGKALGSRNSSWKGGKITLICHHCQEEYKIRPGAFNTSKYCCRTCKDDHQKITGRLWVKILFITIKINNR